MTIPAGLRTLLDAIGPSGQELAPATAFAKLGRQFSEQVDADLLGSVTVTVPGTDATPSRLALVGHIDEIGLIITHIDDKGFLWFAPVGGWDPVILVGQRVSLQTKDGPLLGVVGKKPIHLLDADQRGKAAKLKDLHIDIGAADGDAAKAAVRIGDVAVIDAEPRELLGGRAVARAMDNRLGAYVVIEAARRIAAAGGAPSEVVAVGAVQEEITLGGAKTSAFALEPTVAIVVDVAHATDAPGIDEHEQGSHHFGSGAVIALGAALHPAVTELLIDTAEAEGINHTIEAAGRGTSTDADAVYLSRAGVATALVSIPLRYMHSPVEVVDLADLESAIALVTAFALRLPADLELKRIPN